MKIWHVFLRHLRRWLHPQRMTAEQRAIEMIEELRLRMKVEKLLRQDDPPGA